jgi:predicted Zn-dependent peptidase
VLDSELAKAKNQMKMDYVSNLNSNSKIASTLSYYEVLLGDYKYFANYLKIIDKVSSADIQKAAKLYLNKENRTVAVLNHGKQSHNELQGSMPFAVWDSSTCQFQCTSPGIRPASFSQLEFH